MIQQTRKVADPWLALPTDFHQNGDEVAEVAAAAFGDCAHVETNEEIDTQIYSWDIQIDDNCEENTSACSGSLRLDRIDETIELADGSDGNVLWIRLSDLDLTCADVPVQQGEILFREVLLHRDDDPADGTAGHELRVENLRYDAQDNETLAAENFGGNFYRTEDTIHAEEDDAGFDGVFISGNASFDDSDASRSWDVDLVDTALYAWSATPRGGTLNLRSVDGRYNFETTWIPLTEWSTRATIRSGKELWTACIAHDESKASCD